MRMVNIYSVPSVRLSQRLFEHDLFRRRVSIFRDHASVFLGDKHTAFGAYSGFAVFLADAAAQIDDLAVEARIFLYRHDEPFQRDRLVGIDRPPKPNPEFQSEHRAALGKMR